jgi:biopolymer transport protein ExbD
MKITASFLDLLASLLLLFMTAAMLTAKSTQEQRTPPVTLPKADSEATEVGAAGVQGEVTITVVKEGESVAFFLEQKKMPSLVALEEELKRSFPPRAIIRVDENLPVAVAVRLLVMVSRLGVPASLAYDPHKITERGDKT